MKEMYGHNDAHPLSEPGTAKLKTQLPQNSLQLGNGKKRMHSYHVPKFSPNVHEPHEVLTDAEEWLSQHSKQEAGPFRHHHHPLPHLLQKELSGELKETDEEQRNRRCPQQERRGKLWFPGTSWEVFARDRECCL